MTSARSDGATPRRSSAPPRAWQRMLSGRRLDILDPSPLDIEIEDIALGLSRVARWNGQTVGEHGFSVAQHCLVVVELMVAADPKLPRAARLAGLLHDAAEYVTSDLITPFKRAVGRPYDEIEAKVAEAVHLAFGLPPRVPEAWESAIRAADRAAAFAEAVQLAGFALAEARKVLGYRGRMPSLRLEPWPAEEARRAFLAAFRDLMTDRAATGYDPTGPG
ncbi:YfbR-like 5'-deoxynucleotidase [Magnetospirillum fulvum]|uniref:Metal dependent phosphohydrolase n=1 Tax=Magnetospirillum fulvum TaxID=1082 RepID=A0A1H6HAE8_MAGFU|nr:HD family hydrolase [Magnetospirillum fulvum]SEH31165.1 metal dependent phosphohydrolase [Magnetospirillum fulvum]